MYPSSRGSSRTRKNSPRNHSGEKAADFKGQAALAAQVFLDQCVHHPFMYFPAFYMTKEIVCLGSEASRQKFMSGGPRTSGRTCLRCGSSGCRRRPADFAFSPMWIKHTSLASTSLIWTCILSSMRGGSDETAAEVNAEVLHEKDEERGGEVMPAGGVDARAAELFAQG